MINEARRAAAQRRLAVKTLVEQATAPGASANGEHTAVDHIRRLLARLPERQRLALFLRYYADLDYRSIGRILDVRPGTVAATLHAAQDALRAQLRQEVAR